VIHVDYAEILKLAAPETLVVVAALAVLAADLLFMRELPLSFRRVIGAMIACAGCVAAAAWMFALPQQANLFSGMLVVDPLTQLVKTSLLALAILTVLMSTESNFTTHVGEFFALVLLATVGMMFLVSAEDILMIFVSLELTSLSLYILAAFNKRNVKSAEAALKYFFFGSMAAAITLFGLSLLYGLSGETNLARIAAGVKGTKPDPLLLAAIVMTGIGFGFKVAAAPFHLWAPDAYEGAPGPSAAFIASGSKVASFFIAAKVMLVGFQGAEGSAAWRAGAPGWVPVVAIGAALSVVLGNLTAIVQSSVRRLLAYSAIAHAGYTLVGLLSNTSQGYASVIYYAITYAFTTLGAFGVVTVVQEKTGGDKLSDFAGLSRREPVLAFCMMVFLLSLAGIPPLAGFFGKFYVFLAALGGSGGLGLLWLVVLAIALSAVSLYYYLQVLKQIYVVPASNEKSVAVSSILSRIVISVIALAVVILGCAPNILVGRILTALAAAGFSAR
jgi:NADH-quinone oxidoreductase subunit N